MFNGDERNSNENRPTKPYANFGRKMSGDCDADTNPNPMARHGGVFRACGFFYGTRSSSDYVYIV